MVAIQSCLISFDEGKLFFFGIHATYLLRQPVKMLAGDVTKFCKFCRFWLIYVRGGLPHGRGLSRYEICKLAVRGSSWQGGGGAQTSINRAQNCHQPSRQLSVFSLSIREPLVKFSGRYIGGTRESQSHLKSTNWSNVKERLKKVLLILCWIDHLGFLF